MSSLNMTKLLPTRKGWRVFTNKVQTKLLKLHPSRTVKKPNRLRKTGKKISCWPSFFIQPLIKRKRFKSQTQRHTYQSYSYHFQKRTSAVYIDQLFIEPAVSLVKEHLQQPPIKSATQNNGYIKEKVWPSTSIVKKPVLVDRPENMAGTSKEEGKLRESLDSADEMWESLVLASPQMNGINERAEEFITKFRAEMLLQEQLARHL